MSEAAQQTVIERKPVRDKEGYEYASISEKFKYIMRRRRNSDLPHYPQHEPKGY